MIDASCELPDFVHHDLWSFRVKLDQFAIGRKPRFTEKETEWLTLFRRAADRFCRLSLEQSLDLSFAALCRFRMSGEDFPGYLRRCVVNAHLDHIKHLKAQRRACKRYYERKPVKNEQDEVDARLDLEDAYRKMPPRLAAVMKLYLDHRDGGDIAREQGLSVGHVRRLRRQAEGWVRHLLQDGYAGERIEPEDRQAGNARPRSANSRRAAA